MGAFRILATSLALGAIFGCASLPATPDYAAISAQAMSATRLDGDSAQDERRKALETLTFFQIAPGQTVFEIEAGGGYWTELMSIAVGSGGQIVMQNPAGFLPFIKESLAKRFTPGRLANVRQSVSNFDALDAPSASVDVVTWVQGPHELYYRPNGVSLGDATKSYAEIHRILKPGGVFAVIDHSAKPGAPQTTGNDTHRIDPAIVIGMAEAAGFTLEARGAFLANPADDLEKNVFDPTIRGKSDQFALRFRKKR